MFSNANRNGRLVSCALVVTLIAFACWISSRTRTSVTGITQIKEPDVSIPARVKADYGKLPLSFEANLGQTDNQVHFLTRASGYALFLTANEAVLRSLEKPSNGRVQQSNDTLPSVLRMKLEGANTSPHVSGLEGLPGKINYLVGKDPRQWRKDVPTYGKVRYEAVYPGVDLIYYGNQGRQLEYDFIVAAGADPRQIKLSFAGVDHLELDSRGVLALERSTVYQDRAAGDE